MAEQDIIRIPSLYGGISQQPPHLRFSNQFEDASNAAFSVVNGVSKRQGSLFIAKIPRVRIAASGGSGTFAVGDTVTQSTTGATGRFVAEVDGYMDLDPLTGTFSLATPGTTLTASGGKTRNAGSTLHILPADASLRMHAINRDENEQYLVLFGAGTGGTVLKVLGIGNGVAPSLGILATVTIDAAAQTYLDSGSPTADDIRMVTVADYTIIVNRKVATGYSTSGSYSVSGTTFADYDAMVAATLTNATYYHVLGDTVTHPRGYYLYTAAATNVLDKYKRVPAPSQVKAVIDKTKMPLKLVRTTVSSGSGDPATFTLQQITWVDRLSGDDATNPLPSIFENEKAITDIAYYRDRLVLAGGENVVMSQAGDLFNFFLDDAQNIVDSDPIDRSLSSEEVTVIDYIVPFRASLALFTKAGRQFEVNTSETLTPTTASINPTTRYETLPVRPVLAGETLFFAGRRRFAAAVFEYQFDDIAVSLVAADVTAHVPTLIGLDVRNIVCSPNDRAVFVLPTGGSRVFVYTYFWRGQQKEQSAWTKYDFDDGYSIGDIAAIKSNVYMVVASDSEFVIERFGIGAQPIPSPVYGDDTVDVSTEPPVVIPTEQMIYGPGAASGGFNDRGFAGQAPSNIEWTEDHESDPTPWYTLGDVPANLMKGGGSFEYQASVYSTTTNGFGTDSHRVTASGSGGIHQISTDSDGRTVYRYRVYGTKTVRITDRAGNVTSNTTSSFYFDVLCNATVFDTDSVKRVVVFQSLGTEPLVSAVVYYNSLTDLQSGLVTYGGSVAYDEKMVQVEYSAVRSGVASTVASYTLEFVEGAPLWHDGPSFQALIGD